MRTVSGRVAWMAVAGWLLGSVVAQAYNSVTFKVATGDWNDTNSWDALRVPTTNDDVRVQNGGEVTISTPAVGHWVWIGPPGKARIVDGAAFTNNYLGFSGASSGCLQSGGEVVNGWLVAVGAGATYTQTAGRVRARGSSGLQVGATSSTSDYVLVNGTVDPSQLTVGGTLGTGRFIQYGGTVTNASTIDVGWGYRGFYFQYGGSTYCSAMRVPFVAPEGRCIITNGILRVSGSLQVAYGHRGEVQISGSANVVTPTIRVGQGDAGISTGIWSQVGGTVTASSSIVVAHGAGTKGRCTLGGGTLTGGGLTVGAGANSDSVFTQTGGVLSVTGLTVGNAASTNAYMLTRGGTATVSGNLLVGNNAAVTGRWDMAGGSVTIGGYLYTSYARYGGSVLNLSGGTLSAANETVAWHYDTMSTFAQSGGTNTCSGILLLGYASPKAAYHIAGGLLSAGTISFAQLAGSTGLLHVVGAGPRVQAGTYSQNARGTLEVTLGAGGGMRPMAVTGTASLGGTLKIGREHGVWFTPGMVVTVMTCNVRSGVFARTNFLNDVTCRVNYYSNKVTLDNLRPVPTGTCVTIQ